MKWERIKLAQDEIDEIREAFNLFDTDGSGTIDPSDLQTFRLPLSPSKNCSMARWGVSVEYFGCFLVPHLQELKGKSTETSNQVGGKPWFPHLDRRFLHPSGSAFAPHRPGAS